MNKLYENDKPYHYYKDAKMNKLYDGDKIYIKFFESSDLTDDYKSWFLDDEVTKHSSHGLFPYTHNQHNEMIKMIGERENTKTPNNIIFSVIKIILKMTYAPTQEDISKGIHIGNVALHNINYTNRTAEFACIFGEKSYWGQNIGTEATNFIFKYGFEQLNLNKIYLGTSEKNMGMRKISEKLGMREEGRLINHAYLNGEYENIINYGILKSEFLKQTTNEEFTHLKDYINDK